MLMEISMMDFDEYLYKNHAKQKILNNKFKLVNNFIILQIIKQVYY